MLCIYSTLISGPEQQHALTETCTWYYEGIFLQKIQYLKWKEIYLFIFFHRSSLKFSHTCCAGIFKKKINTSNLLLDCNISFSWNSIFSLKESEEVLWNNSKRKLYILRYSITLRAIYQNNKREFQSIASTYILV
jgi:hypothetical protein